MTCAEFQRVLPYIIDSGGNAEEEAHLQSCTVCSGLVQDLRYIADQAKLLLPMREPSATVWSGIQQSLEREGLVRPSGNVVRLRPGQIGTRPWPWKAMGAAAALIVAVVLLVLYGNHAPQVASTAPVVAQPAAPPDSGDQQVVRTVAERNPDLRATYEKSLNDANDYIRTAEKTVQDNPDDVDAHEQLMHAYRQKAMLYDMALTRATE